MIAERIGLQAIGLEGLDLNGLRRQWRAQLGQRSASAGDVVAMKDGLRTIRRQLARSHLYASSRRSRGLTRISIPSTPSGRRERPTSRAKRTRGGDWFLGATRIRRTRQSSEALLGGKLFDDRGNRMSPSWARKGPARWRYYVSQAALKADKSKAGSIVRVPASDVEALVTEGLGKLTPAAPHLNAGKWSVSRGTPATGPTTPDRGLDGGVL